MKNRISTDDQFELLRYDMVAAQVQGRGITDVRVLEAMREVPRHKFVPATFVHLAYQDTPLPIGSQQTISQPYTVAFMCEALSLIGDEKVLEVGTGCGYGAAVLSRLAREVHTVERIAELAAQARQRLGELGYENVQVHHGDGSLGLPELSPFDTIVVTAAAAQLPRPLATQLAEGGRLLAPLGSTPGEQVMHRFTFRDGHLQDESLGKFVFVPLIGRYGTCHCPTDTN